ncbi:hypothetical protein E0V98_25410 [Salmonella enterica subsp. enterica serovar Poona]|nr:hypothetical protein [Salmonella enterica subsp. enterica serovar Poona]
MKKHISSTRFSKKVSYTDLKSHYDITVTDFEYIQLQMISDAFDMKFEHVVTVILGLGFERFQDEFNCSFGTERMDA